MTWQIDSSHSSIQFTMRHMMISKVCGVFESFSGSVALSEENPEQAVVDP